MFLSSKASRSRLSEAENARRNRLDILKALSQGQISRRDLLKWGLITAGGLIAPIHGLSPFVKSAFASDDNIPTGLPRSPLFGVKPFTQAMPRFDVLPRHPEPGFLNPAPTVEANTTQQSVPAVLGGGGWDHPIHIHFEEGQILARDGQASKVPAAWERGRKDVYRLRPGGSVTLTMQFRDWGGMFMEHCHNTTHEDNAMLLRWEINDGGAPFLRPLPTPIPTPQGVQFRYPTEILPTAFRK